MPSDHMILVKKDKKMDCKGLIGGRKHNNRPVVIYCNTITVEIQAFWPTLQRESRRLGEGSIGNNAQFSVQKQMCHAANLKSADVSGNNYF